MICQDNKHDTDPDSSRIKATFSCEVILVSMPKKPGSNWACGRVIFQSYTFSAGIKCHHCIYVGRLQYLHVYPSSRLEFLLFLILVLTYEAPHKMMMRGMAANAQKPFFWAVEVKKYNDLLAN